MAKQKPLTFPETPENIVNFHPSRATTLLSNIDSYDQRQKKTRGDRTAGSESENPALVPCYYMKHAPLFFLSVLVKSHESVWESYYL